MPLARTLLAGFATLGAVALIAGCGGSDNLSADEFRSQADAICKETDAKIAAIPEPTSEDAFLSYLRSGLPIQQAQLTKLENLKPPSEMKDTFAQAMDLQRQQIAAISAAADRIDSGEGAQAVVRDVSDDIDAIKNQADAKAKDLGLTVCGSDSTATTPTAPATTTAPTTTGATTGRTTAAAPGATVAPAAYVADVQVATSALQGFGELLQSSTSIQDLGNNAAAAQKKLDEFDTAIAKLGTYKLAAAQLDKQRAGLVATGPAVSDVLRRFITAAAAGDIAGLQKLVPEVTSAIGKFQAAATNTG